MTVCHLIAVHYTVKSNRLAIFNTVIHSRLNLHQLDYWLMPGVRVQQSNQS